MSTDKDNVKNRLILLLQRMTRTTRHEEISEIPIWFWTWVYPKQCRIQSFPQTLLLIGKQNSLNNSMQNCYSLYILSPMFCKTSVLCLFHSYKSPHTHTHNSEKLSFHAKCFMKGWFLHLACGSGNEVLPTVNDLFLSLSSIKPSSPWNKVTYM